MLPRRRGGGFVPEKLSSFYSQTTQYIIMKKYITVAALLAAGTAFANADVVAVFNCGGIGARGEWMDTTKGWTSATQDGTTAGSFNVRASGSNITLSSEGSGLLSTGDGGSFTADADAPGTATEIPTELKKLSQGVFDDKTTYDTLWGGSVNLYDAGQTTLKLGGLTANTKYTVYLFSARANTDNNNPGGSATWATETSGATWSVWTLGDSGSAEKNDGFTVWFDGSTTGKNASIVEVTFTTGAEQTSISFSTGDSQRFTLNGIVVDQGSSIPEPSAFGLLAGLGALALVASRRRRK